MTNAPALPIDAVIPQLRAALAESGRAVLIAPPGAGKTTGVPLALLPDIRGRILMLEPRRLATRAAAQRLAETLGEAPGGQVGFRIRGEAVPGRRIEVVTEGILTRMLQSDPSLPGVGCVIFDEFHERSLDADLGLALIVEAREAVRPDLQLLVMSATLDAQPVAQLLEGAPVIVAEGRAFPVETRWLERPLSGGTRLAVEAARLIAHAFAEETEGTLLAFLPGEGDIRRVAASLGDLPAEIVPLYGALPFAQQRAALSQPGPMRRIVLATAIAETSLTIPGVRVVVDAGRARRSRFDPASGMSRLVTERASRAEAEQRRGRAGRVAPGVCYRMWARAEEGAMPAFAPPEIASADLTGLALELAVWGGDPAQMAFLTSPPAAAMAEARALLADLGALDAAGRITPHGRLLAGLPVHPRLAHMLAVAGPAAADLAALLSARAPLKGDGTDVAALLRAMRNPEMGAIRAEAVRLRKRAPKAAVPGLVAGAMASLAYPDRIGLRRPGEAPRFILSGGRGAALPEGDPLAAGPLIVALDLDGAGVEPRIRLAAALSEGDLRSLHEGRITREAVCAWSPRDGRIIALQRERLGALTLTETPWPDPPVELRAAAAVEGLRALGLPWTAAAARLRSRMALLGEPMDDATLLADPDWLLPWLARARTSADLRALDLTEALTARLGWEGQQRLDRLAPPHFTTPLGRRVPIDYGAADPSIEVKLPEMYGVSAHPTVAGRPLRITLLSPAGRPVQVTTDLPGFWDSSYPEVRKDMRGRYPRHPWPEDPRAADPTMRAKPRGT
ncbi:ATP-dependent helicase HrpB [Paracoccus suum]|uniref:ATP-dependent helicase HrpB n=1 Tax=Paracoccus suum TaxID=2259340 RepID=A0A344PIS0_9RHOB|nr:ATP-dependent helicase HrpB [Paracoccus suum]AXC49275.1 ATP-dependent helicase HrpB [Paracoccus suum]